jgi:hypothetical protein
MTEMKYDPCGDSLDELFDLMEHYELANTFNMTFARKSSSSAN